MEIVAKTSNIVGHKQASIYIITLTNGQNFLELFTLFNNTITTPSMKK